MWPRLEEVRAWPPLTDRPYESLGHPPGHLLAEVRVSPEARAAYLGLEPASELPVGAVVAQFQHDPVADRPAGVFVMVKQTREQWQFMALDAGGRIRDPDRAQLCRRCHADAASDYLFGLPRPRPAPEQGMR